MDGAIFTTARFYTTSLEEERVGVIEDGQVQLRTWKQAPKIADQMIRLRLYVGRQRVGQAGAI
jgi:hypothetical protein